MKIKTFKNNNLHIKFNKEDIKDFEKSNLSEFEFIFYNLDLCPIGEEYCISNYNMAIDVSYDGGWNFYRFNYNCIEKLFDCKMVILKPHSEKYYNEFLKEELEAF